VSKLQTNRQRAVIPSTIEHLDDILHSPFRNVYKVLLPVGIPFASFGFDGLVFEFHTEKEVRKEVVEGTIFSNGPLSLSLKG
jgi:hypothetical protein